MLGPEKQEGCYNSITVAGKPCIIHQAKGVTPGAGVPVWMCQCGRKPLNKWLESVVEYLGDRLPLPPMVKNEEVVRGFTRYEPPRTLAGWELEDELAEWNR
jgi:hypothetical protein